MAEPKTKINDASVADFLNAIPDPQVREDCWTITSIMQSATKTSPKMWGSNIVGFGTRQVVYASGKTADWMKIGFSPRKQNIALYAMGAGKKDEKLMAKLGRHECGKGCLYIKRLSDVDLRTLKKLVQTSAQGSKASAGTGKKSKSSGR